MKKLFVLLLGAMLIVTLCACGKDDAEDTAKGADGILSGLQNSFLSRSEDDPAGFDIDSILDGTADSTVLNNLSEKDKQLIIDEAKKDGVDVSFDKDGQITVKDDDGTVIKQNDDGTWTAVGDDGEVAQLGGDWPDNEFTKLIPKPSFSLTAAATDSQAFSVTFASTELDALREYANKVKNAGFNQDTQVEDQDVFGVTIYNFSASNGKGYRIEIFSAMGISGLTITKE